MKKKIITAVLVLSLTLALTAAGAGSPSDPLITRSYAEGAYRNSLIASLGQSVTSVLQSAYDKAAAPLTGASKPTDTHYTAGAQGFALQGGGAVTLKEGASFTLTEGSVTVSAGSGVLVDVTTGQTMSSGALALRHRYVCTEDTSALFTASAPSLFLLDGPYVPGSSLVRQYANYADVAGHEWFVSAVNFVRDHKLFYDYSAAKFRPNDVTTRAELVYALWVQAGSPATAYDAGFTDLTETWYVTAVNWAAQKGITTGVDANRFSPNGGINRAQMVTFLYRATAVRGGSTDQRGDLTRFTDSSMLSTAGWSWSQDSISWAVACGLINGVTDTTLAPDHTSTRAQVASLLMRQGA